MSEGDDTQHRSGLVDVDVEVDGAGREHRHRRMVAIPALLAVVATCLAVVPAIVTMAHVRGLTWVPAGDEAVEALQVARVGGTETPLVGVYSVHGWAHPGPVLYYLLAVPYRVVGGDLEGLFLGAGALSAVSIGLIGWLAWRRRRLLGAIAALAVVMTFLAAKGPSQLVAIWNPNTALLPYFAMLLACWGLLEDDEPLLPVTVGLASVAVQMNVAYGALVAGAAAVVVGLHLVRRREGEQPRRPSARTRRWTVAVAVVLWLPSTVDLLFGSHNLARVGGYFLTGRGGEPVGVADGVGLFSAFLRIGGPWTGGPTPVVAGGVRPEAPWALLVLLGALALTVVLGRRWTQRWMAAPLLASSQLLAGAAAAARIETPVVPYLVMWVLPLAAFAWLALLLGVLDIAGASRAAREDAPMAAPPWWPARPAAALTVGVTVLAAALLIGQSVALTGDADGAGLPRQSSATAVASVVGQLEERDLGVVRFEARSVAEAWTGVAYGIAEHADGFFTSDGHKARKWGRDHVWDGQEVDTVLTITSTDAGTAHDPVARCDATTGQRRIAEWDPLTASDRRRLDAFDARVHAGDELSSYERLAHHDLAQRGLRLVVFGGDRPCGA